MRAANSLMTEIRPIREGEAEEFLRVLCQVFDLDFARARGIFYTEPLFDLKRKWALFQNGQIVSLLTTVPLTFGWGRAIGIAGVATKKENRRQGFAAALMKQVLASSVANGETAAYLFANEPKLYESSGFQVLDHVVRARLRTLPEERLPPSLEFAEIKQAYDAWAEQSPARLRRDHRRWSYWKWNLRVCTGFLGGYLCAEGGLIREALVHRAVEAWPVPPETSWLGLRSIATAMNVPILDPTLELHLMGANSPMLPQMFMTDQF